jgi:hypothetical protein
MPHAWGRSCGGSITSESVRVRGALGGGVGGGRPCTHRAGLQDGCPCHWSPVLPVIAGPVIAGQRSPVPTLALKRPAWQRIHDRAVIAPLPRADGSPARGSLADRPGRCTARPFADAWTPNLIRSRPPPAQRPQPAPATPRQQVRQRVRPRGRGWRWRTAPRDGAGAWPEGHSMAAPQSAQEDCVNAHGFRKLNCFPLHGRPKTIRDRGGKASLRYTLYALFYTDQLNSLYR